MTLRGESWAGAAKSLGSPRPSSKPNAANSRPPETTRPKRCHSNPVSQPRGRFRLSQGAVVNHRRHRLESVRSPNPSATPEPTSCSPSRAISRSPILNLNDRRKCAALVDQVTDLTKDERTNRREVNSAPESEIENLINRGRCDALAVGIDWRRGPCRLRGVFLADTPSDHCRVACRRGRRPPPARQRIWRRPLPLPSRRRPLRLPLRRARRPRPPPRPARTRRRPRRRRRPRVRHLRPRVRHPRRRPRPRPRRPRPAPVRPPSPAPAAKATDAAPTQAAQTAPTATPLAAAGATTGEIPNKTPGSGDKAANELASLKPGFSAARPRLGAQSFEV